MARFIRILFIFVIFFNFCGCAKYVLDVSHELPAEQVYQHNVAGLAVSIAMDLSRRDLHYSARAEDFRDCSGVFHRLINELKERCPGIKGPGKSSRNSRHIAKWYAADDSLFLIRDVFEQDWMIRPGTIMFYGKPKKRYRNITLDTALREISHLGIVTSVNRGANGKVLSYELFHGRSNGKPAAITAYHTRTPTQKKYHPLGNADQQWIGLAWLCNDASCDCGYANADDGEILSAKDRAHARFPKK